jgi:PAS domain S-box-containing protein
MAFLLQKNFTCGSSLQLHSLSYEKMSPEGKLNKDNNRHPGIDDLPLTIVLDERGVILQWSPKARAMFGWNSREVAGLAFHRMVLPEHHHADFLKLLVGYENGSTEHLLNRPIEISACGKDHAEFDISLGISSVIIAGERFCICHISDVTERKMIASKMDKQKEFYENILNTLPTDIAVFDAGHKYLFVNPGAISNEEYRKFIIGKDDYEYAKYRNRDISVAHSRREKFLEVKNTGKEIRWEDSLPDPNGNVITHLRRMYPVYDDSGSLAMVVGFGLDITDRKIMEEKQAALVKQLSEQNTQLIDFCNIVSHNLRAPLVNMSMLVDFIEKSGDPVDQKMLISKFRPVLENLHATLNELVESIQIKQDLEVQVEDNQFGECMRRTLDGLQAEIGKLRAHIKADFSEAPVLRYPPKYLYSILHNLVSNSLKYHSPKRQPVIIVKTEKVDGRIVLSVSDNGLGIDLNKHRHNFFKIGKVFHRHPHAKGFGLFMTKTQIEAMGGRIWVESVPDEGTSFFIEFKN